MGCVSSSLMDDDNDQRRIIGVSAAASASHIVSLTSSTYGILKTLDQSQSQSQSPTNDEIPIPIPPPPPTSDADNAEEEEGIVNINSWELMAGLLDPTTPAKKQTSSQKEHRPGGGNSWCSSAVVLYTTTLRGVRATFEACNAVRAALEAHGVAFQERDVSMDRGFRDQLRALSGSIPPRLLVRGKDVGGAEEVAQLEEDGLLAPMLEGLPKAERGVGGGCCDGCGGMRFLPCFHCSGSRKVALVDRYSRGGGEGGRGWPACSSKKKAAAMVVVVRCGECNENGLVLCPICA